MLTDSRVCYFVLSVEVVCYFVLEVKMKSDTPVC